MTDEINYVHEDAAGAPAPKFFTQRWVKITGVALLAAIALVGAFGAGVVAGERMGGGNQAFGDDHGFSQGGPKGFPGGCPANDPDHCAGTDRGQHDFQLPNNGGTSTNP